jgi:hypothetical protein
MIGSRFIWLLAGAAGERSGEAGVLAAGAADEARAYQTHVTRMRRLSPTAAPKVQAEARRGLDLVDRLERAVRR